MNVIFNSSTSNIKKDLIKLENNTNMNILQKSNPSIKYNDITVLKRIPPLLYSISRYLG